MGMSVWYMIATLFLVLVNGEIFENISTSIYDKPETSSPKPNQQFSTTQEYVLYLTPDQAQDLQATGAIVRPLPQLENVFQQQRRQLSTKDKTEQNLSSNKKYQVDNNINEFYKELLLHQDLAIQSQSKEIPSVKPPARYKYSPKPRQEYASWYVPKINNKTNNRSTEYVRYLPNYEIETLEMKPYSAQPLPGYYFETQSEVKTYSYNGAKENFKQSEVQKSQEALKSIKLQSPEKVSEYRLIQRYEDIQNPAEIQDHEEIFRSAELQIEDKNQKAFEIQNEEIQRLVEAQKFEEIKKSLESLKLDGLQSSFGIQRHEDIQENEQIQRPEEIHPIIQIPTRTFTIERTQNQQRIKLDETSVTNAGPVTFEDKNRNRSDDQEAEKVEATFQISTPLLHAKEEKLSPLVEVQNQHSSLSVQQDKISENIAEQKVLINNERAIQTKLQQITESSTHDTEKFATELDKLKKNLGKQNILAEKIATQRVSKKPQGIVKEELALQRHRPLELEHKLEHLPVIIPRPYPVSWGISHPIPVPVLQFEKDENKKVLPIDVNDEISIHGSKNYYRTVSTPFAAQEQISGDVKHDIPFAYRTHEPENLAILRHIWEH
ncbi:unnamed protein product [Arctia plantaginis]|uniref:Uncharacterized protein n=1 Tax=Arctia plantaginis TaxID=874455 RepID=A0A8S1BB94_ARCPL|nr:unnamed protein product [Arctia plantaginis]